MTNTQLAIEAVQELPDGATLEEIAERITMLAAIRIRAKWPPMLAESCLTRKSSVR